MKAAEYRLRSLAGEATQLKVRTFKPGLTRALPFRAFDGQAFQLWTLTPAGYAVAAAQLCRLVKVPRVDVGAAFAEHSVFLTDLFVELARPFVHAGNAARELPFRWDVAEDVELPWREKALNGAEKSRVIRPDAVLEVQGAQRRFFIECERGTHTLTPVSPDKVQATVRKVERYEAYVSGIADYCTRASHYRLKYADGWPCEVMFLVPTERRRRSTNEALAALRAKRRMSVLARAFTLEEAADYCRSMFPRGVSSQKPAVEFLPRHSQATRQFYGEHEHGAVKDFVLAMTAALVAANSALQRNGFTVVAEPECKGAMLDFLRKAQAEMHRRAPARIRMAEAHRRQASSGAWRCSGPSSPSPK